MSPRLGGGEHWHFAPANYGPDMKTVPHALIHWKRGNIDQKGRGGYAVIAGSYHKSGKRYYWADGCAPDETPLATFPPAWVEAMDKAGGPPAPKDTSSSTSRSSARVRVTKVNQGGTLLGDGDPKVYGGLPSGWSPWARLGPKRLGPPPKISKGTGLHANGGADGLVGGGPETARDG